MSKKPKTVKPRPSKQAPTITEIPEGVPLQRIFDEWYNVRTRGDLRGWTGSGPMHLNKEPVEKK